MSATIVQYNYARRQITWMRKLAGVHVIDIALRAAEDVAEEILRTLDCGADEV